MEMIKKLILFAAIAITAAAQDWSIPVECPLEVRQPYNLKELNFSQGQTPLMAFSVTRRGRPEPVDTDTIVRMIIGPSATSDYFAVATNSIATNSTYFVQWPTIGTNTLNQAWWYTVYFEKGGRRYWSGNGDLFIEPTTSTGDGLTWQEFIREGGDYDYMATLISNKTYRVTIKEESE